MANLDNFQRESIDDLQEFNSGITLLLQHLIRTEKFQPDELPASDWKSVYRVLMIQEDAQAELKRRLIVQIPERILEKNRQLD